MSERALRTERDEHDRTIQRAIRAEHEADRLREDVRLALSEHGTYRDLIERLHLALGDTPNE
jgi:uncharacterized protein Yka (UPF0111/DUF47 family)